MLSSIRVQHYYLPLSFYKASIRPKLTSVKGLKSKVAPRVNEKLDKDGTKLKTFISSRSRLFQRHIHQQKARCENQPSLSIKDIQVTMFKYQTEQNIGLLFLWSVQY